MSATRASEQPSATRTPRTTRARGTPRSTLAVRTAGFALFAGLAAVAVLPAFLPSALPLAEARDGRTSDGHVADPSRTPADVAMDLDFVIEQAWKREGLEPTGTCSDAEFCRRVHLDIVGTIPTAEQVAAFAADDAEDKRAQLVERLLDSPGYARHFTNRWASVLVGEGTNANNREYVPGLFRRWLEERFTDDAPYTDIVSDLVTATGTVYGSAPVNYSGRRNHGAKDLAGAVSKHFLGVQIQCAQCHDHPYEEITQADFNGFAAFFAKMSGRPEVIDYSVLGDNAVRRAEQRIEREYEKFLEQGKTEEEARRLAERRRRRSRNIQDLETLASGNSRAARRAARRPISRDLGEIAKIEPKYLLGDEWAPSEHATRREALAEWIVDPANPYTARALSNRYWAWLVGRGIVHPVDDFSSVNIPSVPAALDLLAEDVASHGFDLKRLIRVIARTRAYGLDSASDSRTPIAEEFFAVGPLKELTPQQTFDSLQLALGVRKDGVRMSGLAGGTPSSIDMSGGRGGMMMGVDGSETSRTERLMQAVARSYFQTFDDDEGDDAEAFTGTVPQGLFLMNSDVINTLLVDGRRSVVPGILDEYDRVPDRLRHLFLRTLSREPTAAELRRFTHFVKNAETVEEDVAAGSTGTAGDAREDRRRRNRNRKRRRTAETREHAAYADVMWALLSSSEFGVNH